MRAKKGKSRYYLAKRTIPNESAFGREGFTFVEIILTLALLTLIVGITVPVSVNMYYRFSFNRAEDTVMTALQEARSRSLYGAERGDWGVYISPEQSVLFQGESFAERQQHLDTLLGVPDNIVEEEVEVVFRHFYGEPDQATTFQLDLSRDRESTITVNEKGVSYVE